MREVAMIAVRFTLMAALCSFAAAVSGCSGGGALPGGMRPSEPTQFDTHQVTIKEFADLPQETSGYYQPSSIAKGPDRSLWVTDEIDQDFGENAVVQIAPSGKARNTFYYQGLSTEGSSLGDIVKGPDGALWITDSYNSQILRMTTAGTFTGYKLGNPPTSIVNGPDKSLWFTQYGGIGRITTGGTITVFGAGGGIQDLAVGSDGALWYTELTSNAIGRITTHGKITQYSKGLTSGAGPYSIAAGPDGALWFTESLGGRIGRITTKGKITEFSHGITPTEEPSGIAAGPDGAMWFTEYEVYNSYQIRESKIARITTGGKITEYSNGITSNAEPTTIAAGPDGNMWFVESALDQTGRVTL